MSKEYYVLLGAVIGGLVALFSTLYNSYHTNNKAKNDFKREHNYNQLKELYFLLYGVVVQSEYVRYFYKKYRNTEMSLKEYPFLEIHQNKTIMHQGKLTEEEIKNAITEFNKEKIVESIIEKSEYSSQRLLKLAVAYRYCHNNYQNKFDDKTVGENFQDEELKLIYLIVKTIVKECNEFLKECEMKYDGKEISYGIMNYNIFDDYNFYF